MIEIKNTGIDQIKQRPNRQRIARQGVHQRCGYRMGVGFFLPLAIQDIPPPLQPYFADHRLGDERGGPDNFEVEGEKRGQCGAMLGR